MDSHTCIIVRCEKAIQGHLFIMLGSRWNRGGLRVPRKLSFWEYRCVRYDPSPLIAIID